MELQSPYYQQQPASNFQQPSYEQQGYHWENVLPQYQQQQAPPQPNQYQHAAASPQIAAASPQLPPPNASPAPPQLPQAPPQLPPPNASPQQPRQPQQQQQQQPNQQPPSSSSSSSSSNPPPGNRNPPSASTPPNPTDPPAPAEPPMSFGKKAWTSVVKRADAHTPVNLLLSPCSAQGFVVFIMVSVFIITAIFSLVQNTKLCSKENGCITCVVKTGPFDATEYNQGCEPIAKTTLDFQLENCATGRITNTLADMQAFTPDKLATFKQNLIDLCTASMQAQCDKTTGLVKDAAKISDCISVSSCATSLSPVGTIAWANTKPVTSCATSVNSLDFSTLIQTGVTNNALTTNSQGMMTGLDTTFMQNMPYFSSMDPSAINNVAMAEIARFRSAFCWVAQLKAEKDNPTSFPLSAAKANKMSLILVTDTSNNVGVVMRPGAYASNCGASGKGSAVNPSGSIYGFNGDAFMYNLLGQMTTASANFPSLMKMSNLDQSDCGSGCAAGKPALIDPLTGSQNCCSKPGWKNIISEAYAFAMFWMSVSAIASALIVALIWGTNHIDWDELKAGAKELKEKKEDAM